MDKLYQLMVVHGLTRESANTHFNNSTYFNKLHFQLKNKLVAGVCTNDFPKISAFSRARCKVFRNVAAVRTLTWHDKTRAGLKLAKETLKLAEKHGWVSDCLELSRELRRLTGTIKNDKETLGYLEKVKLYREALKNECDAEELFTSVAYLSRKEESSEHLRDELLRLQTVNDQNHRFQFFIWYAAFIIEINAGNESTAYSICEQAVQYFGEFDSTLHYVTKWHFVFQLIPYSISKKDSIKAERYIAQSLSIVRSGSYNWHVTLLYKALYGFSIGKPAIALDAWKLQRSKVRKFDNVQVVEWWRIIHAYLAWYEKLEKLVGVGTFRLGKFLNEVALSNQDKQGLNLSIRIVELLHYLADDEKIRYMDGVGRLEQYAKTNLKTDKRGKLFVKLMKAVEMKDYNLSEIRRSTRNVLEELKGADREFSVKVLEKEIIPFELLWADILKLLK